MNEVSTNEPFSFQPSQSAFRADIDAPRPLAFVLSSRSLGDMSVSNQQNRRTFFTYLGIDPATVTSFSQVHSKIVAVDPPTGHVPADSDGGVTNRSDAVLSVTVADCLPICLYDKSSGCMSLVHSGWKGTGIVLGALEIMRNTFGTKTSDVACIIGPGIGPCCYNVDEQRADLFAGIGPGASISRGGEHYIDLKAANAALLYKAGVADVRVSGLCTSCLEDLGSYRRQGPEGFTRMVAVIGHF